MRTVRVFVSSPGDTHFERMRVERVVERLNGELNGVAKLEAIRWESSYYQARATFQQQIPEASACDLVIAILRHRIGTELPPDFPHMPNGEPYPSGTAYEILTAIEASKQKSVPDIYVFRYSEPPLVKLDDEATNRLVTEQWERLKVFFKTWFQAEDGKFKLAFHTFQSTDAFEGEIEKLLRGWLEEKVLKGRSVLWPIDSKGSPFRGLAAFGAKHAPVFFGRSRDITKAVDVLKEAGARGSPFLLIVGASGSGKSSLALAGLVPRLTASGVVPAVDLWRVAVMRPSDDPGGPVASLAASLFESESDLAEDDKGRLPALPELAQSDYATAAELARLLAHADEPCVKPIIGALDKIAEAEQKKSGYDRPVRADLLIVVDQLDELFAGQVNDAERARFAKLLAQLVATGRVWVIATLRADLYERFLKEPELLAMKSKGATYDLAPPGATEIDEIIRGPAAAAGLVYETDWKTGERLDDRLIRDVDRPDMLPLLQFALDYLFEQRVTEKDETRLAFKAYDTLGGLAGAIDKEAERAISGLGKEELDRLPRLLRQLAAPAQMSEMGTPTGAPAGFTIRSVPLAEAAYDPPAERLVKALVDARILLSSGSEQNATIRLAHQRVLDNWKRAKDIVAANAEFYRIRDDVEALRRRWENSKKQRDLLIPKGVPLAEAESIAKRYPGELGAPTLGFIAASGKRARLRQRLVAASAMVFAALAVGATVAGIRAWQAEQRAKRNFDVANSLVTDIAQGLRHVEGMRAEARKKIFDQVSKTLDSAVEVSPDDEQLLGMQATMFEEFASTHAAEGESAEAAESTAKSLEIRLRLVEMGNATGERGQQDISQTLEKIGEYKLEARDDSGALAVYEKILANRRRAAEAEAANPDRQRDVAVALTTIGDLKLRSGDLGAALGHYQECSDIRRKLADSDKGNAQRQSDLEQALNSVAYAKYRLGDFAGALATYGESLAIARALADADKSNALLKRDVALLIASIGDTKIDSGDNAGALEAYKESLAIRRGLVAADAGDSNLKRDTAATLSGIGDALVNSGDKQNALPAYEESIAFLRDLLKIDATNPAWKRDLSIGLNRLGDVKRDSGDNPGALAAYEESLAVRRSLAELDQTNTQWQTDVSYVLQRIGDVKRGTGDTAGALKAFEDSLAIARTLAAANPGSSDLQREVALNLTKIGAVKKDAGDNTGALAVLEESVAIRRDLPNTDLHKWQLDVAENLETMGDLKLAAGDKQAALAVYEEMLSYDRSMVASDAGNTQWQRNMSISLNRVGDAKLSQDDIAGAIAKYEEGLEVRRRLAAADNTVARQQDVSVNLEKIGDAKRKAGDNAGALTAYAEVTTIGRQAVASDATKAQWQRNLAISLSKLADAKAEAKDTEGALAAYEEGLAIRRKLAEDDKNNTGLMWEITTALEKIAEIKGASGEKAAALASYAEAMDVRRQYAAGVLDSGNTSDALQAFEQSLGLARKIAASNPTNPNYQSDIAATLENIAAIKGNTGDVAGALAQYEESLAIRHRLADADKANAKWRQDISATLQKIGELKQNAKDNAGALAAYEETLANDRKIAAANASDMSGQLNVALSLERIAKLKFDTGDSAGALALYEESLGIRRKLYQADASNESYKQGLSFVIEKTGDIKRDSGDGAGALAAYLEMLALDREVASANMGDTKRARIVAVDLNKIADVKLNANDTDGALQAVEESLNIARHIALTDQANMEWQRDISVSLERLGNIKYNTGDKQGALTAYEEMLSIDRRTASADAGNLQREREVMVSLNKVGNTRLDLNDTSGALADYEEGLAIARKLLQADAASTVAQRDVTISLEKIGDAKVKAGDKEGALAALEECLAVRRTLADSDKSNMQWRRDVSLSLDRIGNVKLDAGDIPGAFAAFEESLAIARDLAELRKDSLDAQIDLVVGLYKLAQVTDGEKKNAAIDEGMALLARLDADGKLTDDQRGWTNSFLTLRNGTSSQ